MGLDVLWSLLDRARLGGGGSRLAVLRWAWGVGLAAVPGASSPGGGDYGGGH